MYLWNNMASKLHLRTCATKNSLSLVVCRVQIMPETSINPRVFAFQETNRTISSGFLGLSALGQHNTVFCIASVFRKKSVVE